MPTYTLFEGELAFIIHINERIYIHTLFAALINYKYWTLALRFVFIKTFSDHGGFKTKHVWTWNRPAVDDFAFSCCHWLTQINNKFYKLADISIVIFGYPMI